MAEGVGFEPTAPFGVTDFQDQLLKPLGHPSKSYVFIKKILNLMVCLKGFEPLARGLEGHCSILLSYRHIYWSG